MSAPTLACFPRSGTFARKRSKMGAPKFSRLSREADFRQSEVEGFGLSTFLRLADRTRYARFAGLLLHIL